MTIKELKDRRGYLVGELEKLQFQAKSENRDYTNVEKRQADSYLDEMERLDNQIDNYQGRTLSLKDRLGRENSDDLARLNREGRDEFRHFLQTGQIENRALGVSDNGVLAPDYANDDFVEVLKDFSGMMEASTVRRTDRGGDFPLPVFDNTDNTGDVVAENTQITDTSDPDVSDKTLKQWIYRSDIYKVSRKALLSSVVDLDTYLVRAVGESIGRKLNADLTNGDGSSKARGIMQDVSDSSITTAADDIDYEDLVDLMHSVDIAYRRNGRGKWMGNDSMLKKIRQMTDDNGRPLWVAHDGEFSGQVLGHDFIVNNDMPAFSGGNKALIFGDLSRYWVRLVNQIEVLRLEEKYADFLQVGFIGYVLADGRLTDADAVKHLTIGSQ